MKPTLEEYEDYELLNELAHRCHARMEQKIFGVKVSSSLDRRLITLLYDAGKLILRRVQPKHRV